MNDFILIYDYFFSFVFQQEAILGLKLIYQFLKGIEGLVPFTHKYNFYMENMIHVLKILAQNTEFHHLNLRIFLCV